MQGWSNVDSARSREIGQRFRYAPWDIPRRHRVSGVRPGMRIVDVGCGGGYFSRLLTGDLRHVGEVIGFDSDEGMIEGGRKLNEEQGINDRCTLKVERQRARWREFVDHPEKIKQTPAVALSVNLLVMGKKPEKAWRRRR